MDLNSIAGAVFCITGAFILWQHDALGLVYELSLEPSGSTVINYQGYSSVLFSSLLEQSGLGTRNRVCWISKLQYLNCV